MTTLALLFILASGVGNPAALLKNSDQKATIGTLKDIADGQFYSMDYKADYRLQDFINADLTSQDEITKAAWELLLEKKDTVSYEPMKPNCSAFRAFTPEGDVLFGRNFDYHFKESASIMVRTSPEGGYKSMSMVTMSFFGMDGRQLRDGKTDLSFLMAAPLVQMDGMNEKGLAISVLVVVWKDCAQQYEPGRHSIMTSVMMRMLLDRAASVDEAVEMLKGYNFFCNGTQSDRGPWNKSNYHFLLSDASGKTIVLEYVKENGLDAEGKWVMSVVNEAIATNHFRSPGWLSVGRHDLRYNTMKETLETKNYVMTEAEVMNLLDAVHQTVSDGHEGKTQWSVVYNLTKKTARVCMNHDYTKSYEFSLESF